MKRNEKIIENKTRINVSAIRRNKIVDFCRVVLVDSINREFNKLVNRCRIYSVKKLM